MKLACGKWRDQRRARKNEKRTNWRRVFLFFPKSFGKYDCRWLEFVERRDEFVEGYYEDYWRKRYRTYDQPERII